MEEFRAQEGASAILFSPSKVQKAIELKERREQAALDGKPRETAQNPGESCLESPQGAGSSTEENRQSYSCSSQGGSEGPEAG
jgi:hypothetical protein